jgi:hypothetical protein
MGDGDTGRRTYRENRATQAELRRQQFRKAADDIQQEEDEGNMRVATMAMLVMLAVGLALPGCVAEVAGSRR